MATKVWLVCLNPHSNDYNDEPEYIAVPYDIVGDGKNGKDFLVERAGWHGKKYQHYISKSECYWSKEQAEDVAYAKTWGMLG